MSLLLLIHLCAAVMAVIVIVFIVLDMRRLNDHLITLADDYSDAVHRGDPLTARLVLRMIYAGTESRNQRLLLICAVAFTLTYPVLYQSPAIIIFIAAQVVLGGCVVYLARTSAKRIDNTLREVYDGVEEVDPDDLGTPTSYETSIIDHSEVTDPGNQDRGVNGSGRQ